MKIKLLFGLFLIILWACQNPVNNREKTYVKHEMGVYKPAPEVYVVKTQFDSLFILRLKPDGDLLKGIKIAVDSLKIKNGVVLNGIGSIKSYSIHSVSNTTFPTENVFFKDKGPFDITNLNGFIIDGKVHVHMTISDGTVTYGGHLEVGTRLFTFCVLTVGVMNGTSLKDFDNWNWR